MSGGIFHKTLDGTIGDAQHRESMVVVDGVLGQIMGADPGEPDGWRWVSGPETFSVKTYGAIGDGSTDDTAAIVAAIAACFAAGGGIVLFPRGIYKTTSPIYLPAGVQLLGLNPSSFGSAVFSGLFSAVSAIYAVHTGDAIVDLRGSQGSGISNLTLYGSQASPPKAGIVLGRIATPVESAGFHIFDNLTIDGYFSQAGVYSIASEENLWIHPMIRVVGGGGKYCFATDQGDFLSFFSSHPTSPPDPPLPLQGSSNEYTTILHPWFNNESTDANAACIYIGAGAGTFGFTVVGGACLPRSGSYVEIMVGRPDGLDVNGPINFLGMGGELSGTGPLTGFNLLSQGSRILRGLYIQGWRGTFAAGGKFVRQAAALTIRDSEIRAHGNLGVDSVLDETMIFNSRIDRGNGTTVDRQEGSHYVSGGLALGGASTPLQGAFINHLSVATDPNAEIVGIQLKNPSNTVGNYSGIFNRNSQDGYNASVVCFNLNQNTTLTAQGAVDIFTNAGTGTGLTRRTRTQLGFMVGTVLDPGAGRIAAQNGIVVGTIATPMTELHVASTVTSSPRGIMSAQYNTGADGARFHMRKARGTEAAPAVIVSGDNLGRLVASGYDGVNYLEMASIIFGTQGTIGLTRVPTNLVFQTSTDATPSVMANRAIIDTTGLTITGTGQLTLGTADASGASLIRSGTTLKFRTGNDGADVGMTALTGAFSGQITSTVATGTAPLVVASTTNVANLNASSLNGATFAAPGAIGGGTPSTGAFTTLTGTGGTHTGITALGIRSTGAAFDLTLASAEVFTAGRTLTFNLGDAARTLTLSANATVSQDYSTTGAPQFARLGVGQAAPAANGGASITPGISIVGGATFAALATGKINELFVLTGDTQFGGTFAAWSQIFDRGGSVYGDYALDARTINLRIGGATKARIDATGSLQIGGTAARGTTAGTGRLDLFNSTTAPAGTLTNGISLFAEGGELKVLDAGGASTTLSPHDDAGRWVFDSTDTLTGRRLLIDVERLLRAVNELHGWDFVHEFAIND